MSTLSYDAESISRYHRLHAPAHTADELRAFFEQCERTQLDPWSRQIYTVKRPAYVNGSTTERAMTQVSIDGLRLQAERSGKYGGQVGPFWCGGDGIWVDVWVKPMAELMAAKIGVFRSGWNEPVWGVARFDAYAVVKKDGSLNSMWAKMGDVMVAKCAEALALRKACPAELSGLYTTEEMGDVMATALAKDLQAVPPKVAADAGLEGKLKASDANAAADKAIAKAAILPKSAPAPTPPPTPTPNTEGFADLEAEIKSKTTLAAANACIPIILSLPEPERSAAMSIFKKHRIAMRWETGKVEGSIQLRAMNIMEWTTIERADAGLILIEAMEGEEKAAALEALEVRCFESGWKLRKAPKLAVSAS